MNQGNAGCCWQPFADWQAGQRKVVYCTRACRDMAVSAKTLTIGDKKKKQRIALEGLDRVIFIGVPRCDAALLYRLVKKGIAVEFLDLFSRPQGILQPLRREQLCFWDKQLFFQLQPASRLSLARLIIETKIRNYASLIMKHEGDSSQLSQIAVALAQVGDALTWDALRGHEGHAARLYFEQMASFVGPFSFSGRKKRPSPDPINSMLSFGYTLLHNRLAYSLEQVGLNPRIGFYHVGRGRHWALASDLMEDLRVMVDRLVIDLVKGGMVMPEDFVMRGNQCVFRTAKAFTSFVFAFEEVMSACFTVRFARPGYPAGSRMNLNQWLDATAKAYAGHITDGAPFHPYRVRR